MIRAFFALSLSGEMREEIDEQLAPFRRKRLPVRWVPAENMHVTMRFLGDLTDSLRIDVEERVREAIGGRAPFALSLGRPGAFPHIDKARIFWIGLGDGDEEVRNLAQVIDQAIRPLGFDPEKKFHPHITVGRVKAPLPGDTSDRFARLEITPFRTRIASLQLVKSTLTPKGAIYEVIRKFNFNPAQPGPAHSFGQPD